MRSSTNYDTDRATGVKLAEGHLLQMHEAELKKKFHPFCNGKCFYLRELRVIATDLQKIQWQLTPYLYITVWLMCGVL